MHKVAREWASYTCRASLVLVFMGPIWGLYAVDVIDPDVVSDGEAT